MTPTLLGRWQTRLLLFATVGVLATLPFFLGYIGSGASPVYFWLLGYIAIFGLGWDFLYGYLQTFRWDSDWPGALQLLAGIWEGAFVFAIAFLVGLPEVPRELSLPEFASHYSCVWVSIYLASQSLMRILFPRWRFKGGQWL